MFAWWWHVAALHCDVVPVSFWHRPVTGRPILRSFLASTLTLVITSIKYFHYLSLSLSLFLSLSFSFSFSFSITHSLTLYLLFAILPCICLFDGFINCVFISWDWTPLIQVLKFIGELSCRLVWTNCRFLDFNNSIVMSKLRTDGKTCSARLKGFKLIIDCWLIHFDWNLKGGLTGFKLPIRTAI